MDHLVAAGKLIEELVRGEHLEVRRVDIVRRDLAAHIGEQGRVPTARELDEWLGNHRQVSECFATEALLDELLARHFPAPRAATAAVAPEVHHQDLERQILGGGDDPEPYLVYSDWLQEQGDPLGELIALGVRATTGGPADVERFERHLKLNEEHFLGPAARLIPLWVRPRWRFGLVRELEVTRKIAEESWREVLQLRVCRLLTSINTSEAWDPDTAATIAAHAPPSLRSLTMTGSSNAAYCGGRIPAAQLARLKLAELVVSESYIRFGADSLPPVERLVLHVQQPTRLEEARRDQRLHWQVRELELDLSGYVAAFLVKEVELPQLERLTLDLGGVTRWTLLPDLLRSLAMPSLRGLTLQHGAVDTETLQAIAALPLTSLALIDVGIGDAGIAPVIEALAAMGSLAVVDLSNNELTASGLRAARRLPAQIVSQRQERPGTAAHRRLRKFAGSRLPIAEEIVDAKAWRDSGAEGEVLWARYRGTEPYELFVAGDLRRYGCSCPSSIHPCKHVVALALRHERQSLPQRPSGGIQDRVRERTASDLYSVEDWMAQTGQAPWSGFTGAPEAGEPAAAPQSPPDDDSTDDH